MEAILVVVSERVQVRVFYNAKKHPIIPMISNIILGTLLPFLMYLPETKDPMIAKNNGNNVKSYNLSLEILKNNQSCMTGVLTYNTQIKFITLEFIKTKNCVMISIPYKIY